MNTLKNVNNLWKRERKDLKKARSKLAGFQTIGKIGTDVSIFLLSGKVWNLQIDFD